MSWTFDGKPIDGMSGVYILQTSKKISQLTIDPVSAEHAGKFECIAENEAGVQKFGAYLNVNGT